MAHRTTKHDIDPAYLRALLHEYKGNVTAVGVRLGMSRATAYRHVMLYEDLIAIIDDYKRQRRRTDPETRKVLEASVLEQAKQARAIARDQRKNAEQVGLVRVPYGDAGTIDEEAVWYSLQNCDGNKAAVARDLGVKPSRVRATIGKSPALQELVVEIESARVEELEHVHYRDASDKGTASRIHWLETQKPKQWIRQNLRVELHLTGEDLRDKMGPMSEKQLERLARGDFEILESSTSSGRSGTGTEKTTNVSSDSA